MIVMRKADWELVRNKNNELIPRTSEMLLLKEIL